MLICQTVDHLLDVGGTLRRVRDLLTERRLLFVDIVDFRAAYLRNWSVEDATKIDHPYYLTQDTMEAYLRRAGFDIVRVDYAADHLHVSYLCRPAAPEPTRCPTRRRCATLLREVRFVQNAPAAHVEAQLTCRSDAVLAIVPARGGSKGVPGKNLRPLAGRPLLDYAAEAARAVRRRRSHRLSAPTRRRSPTPGARPASRCRSCARRQLAADDTPMLPVIAARGAELSSRRLDARASSCCCSRRRRCGAPEHVRDAVELLRQSGADSVVTVVEVPRHLSPDYVMRIEDGVLRPFLPEGAARDAPAGCAAGLLARRHGLRVPARHPRALRQHLRRGLPCRW